MLLLACCNFASNAQIVNYDFSINYQPKVKEYWTRYNEFYCQYAKDKNIANLNNGLVRLEHTALIEPFNSHYYDIARNYHDLKDYKSAVKYYYKALSKGYLPSYQYTLPDFMIENDSIAEYKVVLQQLDSIKTHPNCAMDIPFCNLVIALFELDQMTRKMDFFQKDTIIGKPNAEFQVRYFTFYDKQNLKRLLEHIDKYGIPHQNLMTNEAYDAFKILVHHQVQNIDSADNKRLYQLVKHAIEDGRLCNFFLRAAIDYIHWRNNGQYFGSLAQKNKEGKYEYDPPIIQPETVDERRAQWLFRPLEVQMKDIYGDANYVLPKGYVLRK